MTVELPVHLAANPFLSTWVTVHPDGAVELRTGRVELGQGIVTALAQIAADELRVPPEAVRTPATNTASSPDEGVTAGSTSVTLAGEAVRRACAEVRSLFRRAAARRVAVPEESVEVISGDFVTADGELIASYADLAGEVDLEVPAGDPDLDVVLLPPLAKDRARIDLPDKVFGLPRFIQDVSFPGMVHARVVRPPRPGAHLVDAPTEAARGLRGVLRVVREGDFLAVIATREGQAVAAAEHLRDGSSWTSRLTLPVQRDLNSWLRSQRAETTLVRSDGATHNRGATVGGSYSRPFIAHGSIGPGCAVARAEGDRLAIWSNSQAVFRLRRAVATALGLDPENVVVQHAEGPGSYGHNSADDAAMDAALLARAHPGRHVRVLWSREDEFTWEPFGAAMTSDVRASVNAEGRLTDWTYELWSNGHTARPGYVPEHSLLADAQRSGLDQLPPAVDPPAAGAHGSARGSEPYYDIDRVDVTAHRLLTMPIRTSSLRSLGTNLNVFAIESTIDELAVALGRDPLEFRLAHLSDPRARRVLTTAADAAGWRGPRDEDHGRGIAFCRYKNRGSYCAVVADVEATDRIRVVRLTVAIDVGRVVNTDGLRNQVEGGALQTTSWTLLEEVRFDHERITSTDWDEYPILSFSDVPEVDVRVINRPDEPSLGVGEATQGPVPAAIGNAVADALGVRVRRLPFTMANVVAAIEAQT